MNQFRDAQLGMLKTGTGTGENATPLAGYEAQFDRFKQKAAEAKAALDAFTQTNPDIANQAQAISA